MSDNRKTMLEKLQQTAGVPVTLITPSNLKEFVLKDHPLHPAYPYLSYVHRSDYLRCYFMHHYGGAYHDLKACGKPNMFPDAFDAFYADEKAWISGYREIPRGTAIIRGNRSLTMQLRKQWNVLLGCCTFMTKPRTPFTETWLSQVNETLDRVLPRLKSIQTHVGLGYKTDPAYPLYYTELLGTIFHPLCLKFQENLRRDLVLPCTRNYR